MVYVCSLQVKRVMNGVFHSLRGEFGLHQSYQGSDVLGVILSTIKVQCNQYLVFPFHIALQIVRLHQQLIIAAYGWCP